MVLNMLPMSHYMFSALAIINSKYYTLKDTATASLVYGFAFSFRKQCNCVSTKLPLESQFLCYYQ